MCGIFVYVDTQITQDEIFVDNVWVCSGSRQTEKEYKGRK